MGLEGIVSKRADAPYRSGRIDTFIKTKCANEQEFVVGGYSHSTAMPNAVGALVVGYYEGDRLVYAGRIGTGYTHAVARDLWKRLSALEVASTPFDVIPRAEARRRDVRWVEPAMVIEIAFPRLDRGQPGAPGGLQGGARGQARPRSDARDAGGFRGRA